MRDLRFLRNTVARDTRGLRLSPLSIIDPPQRYVPQHPFETIRFDFAAISHNFANGA